MKFKPRVGGVAYARCRSKVCRNRLLALWTPRPPKEEYRYRWESTDVGAEAVKERSLICVAATL